jgi:CHASE3 domain sensor protein
MTSTKKFPTRTLVFTAVISALIGGAAALSFYGKNELSASHNQQQVTAGCLLK